MDILCNFNLFCSLWNCQALEKWPNQIGEKRWQNWRLWDTWIYPFDGCCGRQYDREGYMDGNRLFRTTCSKTFCNMDLGSYLFTATILIGKVTKQLFVFKREHLLSKKINLHIQKYFEFLDLKNLQINFESYFSNYF